MIETFLVLTAGSAITTLAAAIGAWLRSPQGGRLVRVMTGKNEEINLKNKDSSSNLEIGAAELKHRLDELREVESTLERLLHQRGKSSE